MKTILTYFAASATALACLCGSALAQERVEHRDEPRGHAARGPAAHLQLDQRYHHDHYYPPRGYAQAALPHGAISVGFRGGQYFFHGGVWFRPVGARFIVTVPPVGILVPMLPPAYVTLWIGGAPYYYANGVYYAQVAEQQNYMVVEPPPGADAAQPVAPPPPAPDGLPDPILYPRNGQSAAQTEADRQECTRWSMAQAHAAANGQVFQRAMAACMDARGYTVR